MKVFKNNQNIICIYTFNYIFVLLFALLASNTNLQAKKDFYYNYVDNNNEQMPSYLSAKASKGAALLDEAKKDIDNNKILDARAKIMHFRATNTIKVLKPRSDYLYALVLYKQNSAYSSGEAISILNNLIDNSLVKNKELLKVMYLLSQLNQLSKNEKKATYWAKNIFKTFDSNEASLQGYKAISQIYYTSKKHQKAIKLLQKAVTKLKNEDNIAILLDELYLHYLSVNQLENAKKIANLSVTKHLHYYTSNVYLIINKVKHLRMGEHKQEIILFLNSMLEQGNISKDKLDYIRFELANIYMDVNTKDNNYRLKAKKLYEEIMLGVVKNKFYKLSKLRRDEVLMREDKISTKTFYRRYTSYDVHKEKALVQDLLFALRDKDYKFLIKKSTSILSDKIFANYGYKTQKNFFDIAYRHMIKNAISNQDCENLAFYTYTLDEQNIIDTIDNPNQVKVYTECMLLHPNLKAYEVIKDIVKTKKSASLDFFIEKLAISLGRYKEAYYFSKHIQQLRNVKISSKELLYGLIIVMQLDSIDKYDRYFNYSQKYPQYIIANENNPWIIDYYYYYYLYLMRHSRDDMAFEVLKKLHQAQQKYEVYVYSPFAEISLAGNFHMNYGYQNTIDVIKHAFTHSQSNSNENLIQMYYYMAKSYSKLNQKEQAKKYAKKCLKVRVKSIYKNICKQIVQGI